jgi:hypothetical protein
VSLALQVICSCGQANSRSFLTTKETILTDKLRIEVLSGARESVTAGAAVEIKPSAFSEVLRKHRPDMVASYEKANADWNQQSANSTKKRFCQTDEGERFALDFLGLPHFELRAHQPRDPFATMRYPCCPPETFTLHDGKLFNQESLLLYAKPDPSYYSYPDNVFISAELLDPILAANLATFEPKGGRDAPKAEYETLLLEIREKISAENYVRTVVAKGSRIDNRRDFGAMRMCPKCYLPKFERECGQLTTHHGQVMRTGTIDNSCPGCGWFASHIMDMPLFDSRLHDCTYGQRKGFLLLPVIEAVSRLQECIRRLPEILVESAVPALVSSISPDFLRFVLSSMITTLNRYALFLDMTQTQQKKQTVSDSDLKIMKDMVKYLNPASAEFQRLSQMAPALLHVPSNHLNLFDHHRMAVAGDIFNQIRIFFVSVIFYVASKNLTVVHLHDVLPGSPAKSLLAAILQRDLSAASMHVQNHKISLPLPADGFNIDGLKHSSKQYAMLFFRNCFDYSFLRNLCARNGLSSINEVVFAFSRYLDIPTLHTVASHIARREIVHDFFAWFQASAIRQIRIPSRQDVHAWTNERLQYGAGAPADKQLSSPHLQRGHEQRGEDQDDLAVQHDEEDENPSPHPWRHGERRFVYANDEVDDAPHDPQRHLVNWDEDEWLAWIGGGRAGGGDGRRRWRR